MTKQTSSNQLADSLGNRTNDMTKQLLAQHADNEKLVGVNSASMKQLSVESAEILKAAGLSLKQQKERSITHHHQLVDMVSLFIFFKYNLLNIVNRHIFSLINHQIITI